MPWKDRRPLALTTVLRDNRRGRGDLDEVAAHIAPALSARVRFETGSAENLSNLMRRPVDLSTLLPLADATLRTARHGAARRALDVDMGRYLLLVTAPCNDCDDVRWPVAGTVCTARSSARDRCSTDPSA